MLRIASKDLQEPDTFLKFSSVSILHVTVWVRFLKMHPMLDTKNASCHAVVTAIINFW